MNTICLFYNKSVRYKSVRYFIMAPQLDIFDLTDYNKRGKPIVTQQS